MTTLSCCAQLQSKSQIEFSAVMPLAAGQACNCAFDWTHTREFAPAIWTFVDISPGAFTDGKRQIVAALFVGDSEIAARKTPLGSVRENSASASAELGKNMRQFMAQSAMDLGWVLKQTRVQRNQFLAIVSATGSCCET